MAEISKIKIGTGTMAKIYDIKDTVARERIVGGIHYIGKTNTALTDGATTKPIKKYDAETAAWVDYNQENGDIVIYEKAEGRHLEFIWSGEHWDEFGSTGELGSGAFMNLEEKEINLAHTHTLNYSNEQAAVSLSLGETSTGSTDVLTNVELKTVTTGTGIDVVTGTSVDGSAIPTIIAPDLKAITYTPEGTVSIADGSATTTTGGGVDYGTADSEKQLNVTGSTTSLTHTASLNNLKTTIDGTKATYSVAGTIDPTVTVGDITAKVNSSSVSCGVAGTDKTIAAVDGEVLVLQETALGSVSAGSYKEVASVTVTKPTIGVAIGAVELNGTGIAGLTAATTGTVSVGDHTLIQGKVVLPELVYTAPKYLKWGAATFAGKKATLQPTYSLTYIQEGYCANNSTSGGQYNGTPGGASIAFNAMLSTSKVALGLTKQAITGTSTYAKATSANSSLSKYTLIAKKA